MSQESVEIVRASYDAYARGDFKSSVSAYATDSEWDDRRFRPDGRVHRGQEEIAELVRSWRGAFIEHTWETERVVDAGDDVVIVYVERGRGKGSGVVVESRRGHVVTVEGGRIVRTVVYPTAAAALEAAGLSE